MKKELQTPEVITKMYDLTRKYTRILQPQIYKQYRGDVDDLASEYFMMFMSERGLKKKETLLDKYDSSMRPKTMTDEVYFSAFIKLCVRRALGDSSKMDPIGRIKSLDELQEKCGDAIANSFDIAMQDDESIDDMDLSGLKTVINDRISTMSKLELTNLKTYYKRVKNALAPQFKEVFGEALSIK